MLGQFQLMHAQCLYAIVMSNSNEWLDAWYTLERFIMHLLHHLTIARARSARLLHDLRQKP